MRDEPLLSAAERAALTGASWFAGLPAMVRHDVLRALRVRRHADGERIFSQGEPVNDWLACAAGAVRIASVTPGGKPLTLTFVQPGRWFGDPPLAGDEQRSHDAHAQG